MKKLKIIIIILLLLIICLRAKNTQYHFQIIEKDNQIEKLKQENMKSKLILQVHDELLVEVHKDELDEVKEILKNEMENAVKLDVPLEIDMHLGATWFEAK